MTARHLYIHVPFCARRCSYCDFAIAVRSVVPVSEYLDALEKELLSLPAANLGGILDTVYLGGGTPSRLGPEGIRDLLSLVRRHFTIADNAEVTIEVNPDDVRPDAPAAWIAAGVNRASVGVQSFDDSVLAWMHRTHDSSQAHAAVAALRDAGFTNISVDLIFALPDSLGRSWRSDLTQALALQPDHISLYGLTIEPHTPIARWEANRSLVPASEERYAEDFLLAHEMAADAGFVHYEVSNFERGGKRSRHNSVYWSGAPYLGVGPSAHSFDGYTRSWNVPQYAEWIERLSSGESVIQDSERLTPENQRSERVYLGLRTMTGLAATGKDLDKARTWNGEGWADIEGDVVRLTPEGWLRLDSLATGLTGL